MPKFKDNGLEIEKVEEVKSKVKNKTDITQLDTLNNSRLSFLEKPEKEVAVAPTYTPRNFKEQFKIYKSGATYRLYVYVPDDASWKLVALT